MDQGSVLQSRLVCPNQLSPEICALLICAKVVVGSADIKELQAALSNCLSVEQLCETAVRHRMLGHLHKLITSSPSVTIDQALAQRLSEIQHAATLRSMRQTSQLLRLLGTLDSAGIAAIPFKGLVLAQEVYGDIGMRNSTDVDLLVDANQVDAARQTLLLAGLVDRDSFNSKLSQRWTINHGQIVLAAPESRLFVDLHWKINVGLGRRSFDFGSIDSRAVMTQLVGREIRSPGRLDMFLITCIEGTRDRWTTVGRLLDVSAQVQRMSPEEWSDLLDLARLHGCHRRVLVAVGYVCRTLGLGVPRPVTQATASDRISRFLIGTIQVDVLERGLRDQLGDKLSYLFWEAATEDRMLDGLAQTLSRLFLPGPADWAVVSFPRWLEWLYYPLRPLRLTVKWVKRACRPRSRRSQG